MINNYVSLESLSLLCNFLIGFIFLVFSRSLKYRFTFDGCDIYFFPMFVPRYITVSYPGWIIFLSIGSDLTLKIVKFNRRWKYFFFVSDRCRDVGIFGQRWCSVHAAFGSEGNLHLRYHGVKWFNRKGSWSLAPRRCMIRLSTIMEMLLWRSFVPLLYVTRWCKWMCKT